MSQIEPWKMSNGQFEESVSKELERTDAANHEPRLLLAQHGFFREAYYLSMAYDGKLAFEVRWVSPAADLLEENGYQKLAAQFRENW